MGKCGIGNKSVETKIKRVELKIKSVQFKIKGVEIKTKRLHYIFRYTVCKLGLLGNSWVFEAF